MTETQAINLCSDPDFLKRISFSLAKTAKTIHAEVIAGPRTQLATRVAMAPDQYAKAFAFVALASLSGAALAAIATASDISQASIDAQIAAVWDTFTG